MRGCAAAIASPAARASATKARLAMTVSVDVPAARPPIQRRVSAARHGHDARARRDAGLGGQARDDEDRRRAAHIPTMTVREFECFRLR